MRNRRIHRASAGVFSTAIAALAVGLFSSPVFAAEPASTARGFDTPQQAAEALVAAAEKDDVDALLAILGPAGKDLLVSGDAVEDKNGRAKFAEAARSKLDVTRPEPNKAVVSVGADDWPLPIPIVKSGGKWRFDAKAGRREILARRIGGNELDAITLLRGYVEAQHEYASQVHDASGMLQYAQKAISTPGKQDGLAWKNPDGSIGGPMGDEVAAALAEGYTKKSEPYNGYHFRILTSQGTAAPRGARNYVVGGAMIGGFAMVAWPATYDVTGIQTFIVNQDGIVYQKDLGPNTSKLAPAIKSYNPDKGWIETDDALEPEED
jgi:hypothetical protein